MLTDRATKAIAWALKSTGEYPTPEQLVLQRIAPTKDVAIALISEYIGNPVEPAPLQKPAKNVVIPVSPTQKSVAVVPKTHIHFSTGLLKVCAGLIALPAIPRSFEYVREFFANSGSPDFFAIIMAAMTTGVVFIFPQVMVALWREGERRPKRLGFFGLITLSLLVFVLFSLSASVVGMYNNRTTSVQQTSGNDAATVAMQHRLHDIVAVELPRRQKMITEQSAIVDNVTKYLNQFEPGTIEYNRAYAQISEANRLEQVYNRQIDSLQTEKTSIENNKEVQVTKRAMGIDWLSHLFGFDIEFWVTLIFSIALELIGPACMAVALFL